MGIQAPADIQPGARFPLAVIVAPGGLEFPGRAEIGQELAPRLGFQPLQAGEVGEPAHEAAIAAGHHHPAGELADGALVGAAEVDAPGLRTLAGLESQERQGHLQLRRPAVFIYDDRTFPHPVPAGVEGVVVVDDLVLLHPGGIHLEDEGRSPIVVGIHGDAEPVALAVLVAPVQPAHDGGAAPIQAEIVMHPGADVEEVVVVEDADFRALAGGLAPLGPLLAEAGGGRRSGPGGLVQAAVQKHGGGGPYGLEA